MQFWTSADPSMGSIHVSGDVNQRTPVPSLTATGRNEVFFKASKWKHARGDLNRTFSLFTYIFVVMKISVPIWCHLKLVMIEHMQCICVNNNTKLLDAVCKMSHQHQPTVLFVHIQIYAKSTQTYQQILCSVISSYWSNR